MTISGESLADRMSYIMKPPQAKKDEDVMMEFEKWEDEMRECRGLGATEMAYDHELTALRCLVTPGIKEQIDYADANMESQDVLGRYKKAYGVVVNWARKKRDDSGRSSKKTSSSPMDIGNVGGQMQWNTGQTSAWDQGTTGWNLGGGQHQMGKGNGADGGIYSVKGKGKGKGKQQYGYGYGGYKGGGKGEG